MSQPAANSNQPPVVKWVTVEHLTARRQRLFLNGNQTPYFVTDSMGMSHLRSQGDRYGLWGAGMNESGCAMLLGSANKVGALKHRAEQYAIERVAA